MRRKNVSVRKCSANRVRTRLTWIAVEDCHACSGRQRGRWWTPLEFGGGQSDRRLCGERSDDHRNDERKGDQTSHLVPPSWRLQTAPLQVLTKPLQYDSLYGHAILLRVRAIPTVSRRHN